MGLHQLWTFQWQILIQFCDELLKSYLLLVDQRKMFIILVYNSQSFLEYIINAIVQKSVGYESMGSNGKTKQKTIGQEKIWERIYECVINPWLECHISWHSCLAKSFSFWLVFSHSLSTWSSNFSFVWIFISNSNSQQEFSILTLQTSNL